MKLVKTAFGLLLVLVLALGLIAVTATAEEGEYVYLSISFDGQYIDDQNGEPVVFLPVPLDTIAAVDLTEYGLDHMRFDADGDGNYETTALQLMIYAHEEIYGGDWSEVNFSDFPGSSYFAGGIFGFTENLMYFHNGDFPVDPSQVSDFMTIGATSDRIVLQAGDFLDVASFSCYSFLWDTQGGFHFFADENGNYTHEYQTEAGQELSVHLLHSFCDLMYGEAWLVDAADYTLYYGTAYGEALGELTTDEAGMAQLCIETPGTYYIWCEGGHGDDVTHTSCDYFFETGMPCIVSAPAYSKIIVKGEEQPEDQIFDIDVSRMILGNALEFQFGVDKANIPDTTGYYAVIEKTWADGTTTEKTIPATEWGTVGTYWAIVYDGIAAKEMSDVFYVTVYSADGVAVSTTKTDSVRDYVMRNVDGSTDILKTLMVNMLNYGAAAQVQFNYDTDNLANSLLTNTQKAWASTGVAEMTSQLVKGTNYMGTRLVLESRIQLQVAFKGMTRDMYAIYSFTDNNGKLQSVRVEGADFVDVGVLGVEMSALVYADARNVVEITVFSADGTVYGTATDSIEGYVKRNAKGETDVSMELMKFADSAKAYLYEG